MQEQFTINLQAAQYRQREGESILDALLRGGESLEYQCKQGYCGACALPLVEGEVTYQLEPLGAVRAGMFLPCCTTPNTNLVIARPL